jgi:hypothetical protein
MVTLKAQKADSIFGSQGATKTYVKSKINAIPASTPGGSDGDIQVNDSGAFGALTGGTDGQFAQFTGASTIGNIDSMSVSTDGYTHSKTFIPQITTASRVNTSWSVDLDAATPLSPFYIFKVDTGTANRKCTITLPSTKAIEGQTFDLVGYAHADVADPSPYLAEVVLRTAAGGLAYSDLINGVDHTATDFEIADVQGSSGTGPVTDIEGWKIIFTGVSEIGWLVMPMNSYSG